MTESQILKLVPTVGGGVTAVSIALKLHPVKGRRPERSDEIKPVVAAVSDHLAALRAKHLVRRIGIYYWGTA